MFMYNMYLQLRNLSDKSAKRPNMLLLVSSTLLFMLITSVSSRSAASEMPSYAFVTLEVGYRGRSRLRGCRGS